MSGKGPQQVGTAELVTPEQRAALNQILGMDLGPLFDPEQQREFFQAQVADPTMQHFREQTIPDLNELFIGQGAASSSGLNRAITQAAANVESGLAGQLSQFQQQGQQNQLQALIAALGRQQQQPIVSQGTSPLGSALGLAGTVGGAFLGGPGGGALGSKLFGGV